MNFVLMLQAYLSASEVRNAELMKALNKNIANPLIKQVLLFAEPNCKQRYLNALDKQYVSKVTFTTIVKRCKYSDMIQKANTTYRDQKIILANTDIYFDDTLKEVLKIDLRGKFLAITRLDPDGNGGWVHFGGLKPEQTQDAWIFKSPVNILAQIELGRPGCENMFAQAAVNAKLQVLNPALSVRVYHEHSSNIRTWVEQRDRVRGKYFFPPICDIYGEPGYVPNYCI